MNGDQSIGYVTSGGFAHFVNKSVAFTFIDQNKIKAYMWWRIASLHGDSDAVTLLKLLSNEINENDQKIAINLADKCVKNNFKAC